MKLTDRKNWHAKTSRLNENRELKVGDQVIDVDKNRGIVVKIEPGIDSEDHGGIFVWQLDRLNYGADNCEHYAHFNWQPYLRLCD